MDCLPANYDVLHDRLSSKFLKSKFLKSNFLISIAHDSASKLSASIKYKQCLPLDLMVLQVQDKGWHHNIQHMQVPKLVQCLEGASMAENVDNFKCQA